MVWPHGLSTHHSAADASSMEPSYRAVVRNRLATPGRRRDDKPLGQVTEWLIHCREHHNRKALLSLCQRQNGDGPRYFHLGGYSYTSTPISTHGSYDSTEIENAINEALLLEYCMIVLARDT